MRAVVGLRWSVLSGLGAAFARPRRNPVVRRAQPLLWVIVLVLCCTPAARSSVLPGGFVATADGQDATIVAGISAGSDSGDCCWMARIATFVAWQPPKADRLIVGLFAPPYALHQREPVRVIINGRAQRVCCVQRGGSRLIVALAPSATVRRLDVEITFARDFRPVDVGKGPDLRRLSVLLRGIAFEDMRTGVQLEGATEPVAPPLLPASLSLAIILVGLLGATALTLARPALGIAALIVSEPFALAVQGFGTTATLPKAVLIGVTIAVLITSFRRAPRFGATFGWNGFALCLVVLCAAIASPGAGDQHAALRETLKLVEYALAFAIVYLAYRWDSSSTILIRALAITTLAVVALALVQLVLGGASSTLVDGRLLPRLAGPLEGPNQFAGYLDLSLPMLLAAVLFVRPRRLALSALIVAAAGLVLTLSRGGIFAGIAGALVVGIAAYWPGRLVRTLLVPLALWVAGIAVSIGVGFGRMPFAAALFGSTGDWRGGLGTRTLLWRNAIALWRAHPWLGVGPGNFELRSYVMSGVRTHANSLYLNTLAETGIAGFIAIVGFTVVPVILLLRRAQNWVVAGVLGSWIAFAFHQVLDTLWIYPKVGTLAIVLLAVASATCDTLPHREDVEDLRA